MQEEDDRISVVVAADEDPLGVSAEPNFAKLGDRARAVNSWRIRGTDDDYRYNGRDDDDECSKRDGNDTRGSHEKVAG